VMATPTFSRLYVTPHLGIAYAPTWLFAKEFASGALRHLFKEYALPKPIYALRPGGRRLAAKVRAFIDFMEEVLARELSAAVSRTARRRS
jgi:DNA-binding transcriptional LysR family regulator